MDIIAIYIIFSKITMKTVLTSQFFFFILGGDSTSCGANVGYEEMEYVWSFVVLVRILNYRLLEGFARLSTGVPAHVSMKANDFFRN